MGGRSRGRNADLCAGADLERHWSGNSRRFGPARSQRWPGWRDDDRTATSVHRHGSTVVSLSVFNGVGEFSLADAGAEALDRAIGASAAVGGDSHNTGIYRA